MIGSILFAAAALYGSQPPPYFTAQERWACTFDAFEGGGTVTSYFGVYRSHVADELGGIDQSIAQNDAAALVFVMSDLGNTDIEGKTRKWALISMIDKRTKEYKRTLVDFDGPPKEVSGSCRPY